MLEMEKAIILLKKCASNPECSDYVKECTKNEEYNKF